MTQITEQNQSNLVEENIIDNPADIAAEMKRLSSAWLQAVQNVQRNPKPLVDEPLVDVDEPVMISVDELQTILNDRPIALLCNAIDKLDSSLAKIRSLYRSQVFTEEEQRNSDLGIADGSDSELVHAIGAELKELRAVLKKAIQQIKAES